MKRLLLPMFTVVAVTGCGTATTSLETTDISTTSSTSTTSTTTTSTVPETTTTTTIPAPEGGWKCPSFISLAQYVGWPTSELHTLDTIMWRESRCHTYSHNVDDPMGGSRGLMQINGFWCKQTKYNQIGWLQAQGVLNTCDQLFDPIINLQAALLIWQRPAGWKAWATAPSR